MRNFLSVAVLVAAPALAPAQAGGDKPGGIPADTQIQSTKSGLKYSILVAGKPGTNPKRGDKVKVHYTGWLLDGTKFDSSRDRGEPFEFEIGGRVIGGWNEGLTLMTVGSRHKFTIPHELGYGQRGKGKIPPGATLVFDIELLSVARMPEFRKANPKLQKTTDSGLKYEPITAGSGKPLTKDQAFKMAYALWTVDGRLLDSSEKQGQPIAGRIADMRLPFLKEAPLLLCRGARFRFEVPRKIGIRMDSVWELEMLEILDPLPVPKFALSAPEKQKKTESTLLYEVIQEGTGKTPKVTDKVLVHYAGWLTNGTLFDSSFQRGEPTELGLNQVIPGWREGLMLMKEGAVYKFTIPPDLAYGAGGAPPTIGPNATLVFHLELKKVK